MMIMTYYKYVFMYIWQVRILMFAILSMTGSQDENEKTTFKESDISE